MERYLDPFADEEPLPAAPDDHARHEAAEAWIAREEAWAVEMAADARDAEGTDE